MQVAAKLYLVFFIFLSTNYLEAKNCEVFTKKEVSYMRDALKNGTISIDKKGIFSPPVIVESGDDLILELKEQGSLIALFSTKKLYITFMQYLRKINKNPKLFENKEVKYTKEGEQHIFSLSCEQKKIMIKINIVGKEIEDFGSPESMIIYYFEKEDDDRVILTEVNAAG